MSLEFPMEDDRLVRLCLVQEKVHKGTCAAAAIPQKPAHSVLAAAGQVAKMEASCATDQGPASSGGNFSFSPLP